MAFNNYSQEYRTHEKPTRRAEMRHAIRIVAAKSVAIWWLRFPVVNWAGGDNRGVIGMAW
jgi:hypothetical protein